MALREPGDGMTSQIIIRAGIPVRFLIAIPVTLVLFLLATVDSDAEGRMTDLWYWVWYR